ncbi:hypothetical protein CMO89_00410 [Candidatus Woesearchaeota archaeon]|nr:hypothetical protein [Candidatus Woesearchaeota archaeon]|tara:strand:+ start:10613 stop:11170 length:558 start_codon:yes stop_codon:yes gene_type:complete
MILIGLCGTIGAGKGTVSEYLIKKYGFKVITMGDIVREACKEEGQEPNRENCQKLQRERVRKHGKDYWTRKVTETVKKNKWERAIFDGVRYPIDAELPKKVFREKYVVILVDADSKIRFGRLKKRGRVGDPETYKQFLEQERKEKEFFSLDKTLKMKDYVLYNNGDLKVLYKETDKVMSKLGVNS